ncbi:MAG: hypothetical protein C0599_07200 [Salinivirgaceae bacterium]|nr:MAG: hypothetical protein C0599_07200 [Salinivirgaceae bacterium]
MRGIRNISMVMIAIAQLLIIAHAVIPHHHHQDNLSQTEDCCHHEHQKTHADVLFDLEQHDSDDCCSACHFLNVLVSQISVDHHFIQVSYDFNLAVSDYQQLIFSDKDPDIISPHLLRQYLRAPPVC